MTSSIRSLIATGTKLWFDSIEPTGVVESKRSGVTGATSNPIIVTEIIQNPKYREQITKMKSQGKSAYDIAWQINNQFVTAAENEFFPVFEHTRGGKSYSRRGLKNLPRHNEISLS